MVWLLVISSSHNLVRIYCIDNLSVYSIFKKKILKTQRVPIIVGGSNSYIEKLVEDPVFMFKYKYNSCFIWIDVEQSVLNRRIDMKVDQMVKVGNFCNNFVYQSRYTIMQLA